MAGLGYVRRGVFLLLWACLPFVAGAKDPAVLENVADAEYRFTHLAGRPGFEEAWQAPNRVQGFRSTVLPSGFRLVPRVEDDLASGPSWQWGLELRRWGRPGSKTDALHVAPVIERNEAAYDRGGVVESYVNDRRGLEQLFRFGHAPDGAHDRVEIDLALVGDLSPVFAVDGQSVDFVGRSVVRLLHYAELVVTDAEGKVLPSHMEPLAEPGVPGIRLVFDDHGAVYPVTVDPLTTSPIASAEGNQVNAFFGWSVATAGDVNGDGYSDVIVGAPYFDNGQTDEGRAFLFLGSPSGLSSTPAWTAESDQADANFGWSVGPAGDVNGDGYQDVLVGAPNYNGPEFDGGRAYLYLGSASGLSPTPAWTADGDQGPAYLGYSLGTAGDVNGDGYADVIVGAWTYDHGQNDEGRAYVYLGSAAGLATTPAWTTEGDQTGAEYGYSVATAGDVDGDGYDDVIVGAPYYDNGQGDEGRVFVYLGSASGLATTAAFTAESNQLSGWMGWSVATAGDVNGDGFADVIVGAPGYDNGQTDEGRAYVYLGFPDGPQSVPLTIEINQASAGFGRAVGTAGDINGDGLADVIVGAELWDNGQGDEGGVFVYTGWGPGLHLPTPAWTAESNQGAAYLGRSVGTAGDVNGDGFSDVVAGAYSYDNGQANEGSAFVYAGSAAGLELVASTVHEAGQINSLFGHSVASVGDVNGDGFSDAIAGAYDYSDGEPSEGGAFLYLGGSQGLAVAPAWTAEGDQENALLGYSVASAGDVNGDGFDDVVVGAPLYDNDQPDEGRVYVYLGSASGLASTPSWTAEGDQADAGFGWSVATAGDVNGDGFDDVIVGARTFSNGETGEGRAYVYLGSATGLAANPAWTAESDVISASFGGAVASAGDVNGDGFDDLIVGAFDYDGILGAGGRAFLYPGSPAGPTLVPTWSAGSGQSNSKFGYSVASAGDVNGDGYADVVVGAIFFGNPESDEGRAYLYLGSASGLGTTPVWTTEGNQQLAQHGSAVASAGDVNGDGYSDLAIGADGAANGQSFEGRVHVYLGSPAGVPTVPSWTVESNQVNAALGAALGSGDFNGDGFSDLVAGAVAYDGEGAMLTFLGGDRIEGKGDRAVRQARLDGATPIALGGKADSETEFRLRTKALTPAGRNRVRLEWEVRPLGVPFSGVATGSSAFTDSGSISPFAFNEPVTGLAEGTFYHWRARLVTRSPYFPHTTWKTLAGNNATETKLHTTGCIDRDGDGYGALGDPSCVDLVPDCNEAEPLLWSTPGPTENLRFTTKTTLVWDPPIEPGAPVSDLTYNTVRSGNAATFLLSDCVESIDGPNTTAEDPSLPSSDRVFFYLSQARNLCSQGLGSLGDGSGGIPRLGHSCP